jgi:hypothetical protein
MYVCTYINTTEEEKWKAGVIIILLLRELLSTLRRNHSINKSLRISIQIHHFHQLATFSAPTAKEGFYWRVRWRDNSSYSYLTSPIFAWKSIRHGMELIRLFFRHSLQYHDVQGTTLAFTSILRIYKSF